MLRSFLEASILDHDSLECSLAHILADRLTSPAMPASQLFQVSRKGDGAARGREGRWVLVELPPTCQGERAAIADIMLAAAQ